MTELIDERKISFPELHLLHTLEDFQTHLLTLLKNTRQRLAILSNELDPLLFSRAEINDEMSRLARNHRQADIRILIKNAQTMVAQSHSLLQLHRRLPSKISIRLLSFEPKNADMAYVIADRRVVLMQNDQSAYEGFCNYKAQAEAKHFLEEFDYLWGNHSREDPQLRELSL